MPALQYKLALHTQLWLNRNESTVHVSIYFLSASLPANTTYSLTVRSPLANYTIPNGIGGDFSMQLPPDGTGDVVLAVQYNYTDSVDDGTISTNLGLTALRVPFVGWLPQLGGVLDGQNYTCSAVGSTNSTSSTRHITANKCLCCNADDTYLADTLTCPIMNILTTNKGDGDKPNAAHVSSFVGYLLSMCAAISLYSGFHSSQKVMDW